MEKYAIEYHKKILRVSCEETQKHFSANIQEWWYDMVVAIVTSIVSILFISGKLGRNDFMVLAFSVLCGLLAGYAFRFLYNLFWQVPANLHKEENEIANKYTWNDVEIKPISSDKSETKIAGLVVVNKKQFGIKKMRAEIIATRNGDLYFTSSMNTPLEIPVTSEMIWGGVFVPAQNSKNPAFFLISNKIVESEKALLLPVNLKDVEAGRYNPQQLEKNSVYVISVNFYGEVEGRKMDDFHANYKIKVTDTSVEFSLAQ